MAPFSGSIQLLIRTTAQWAIAPDNAIVLKSGQPGLEKLGTGGVRFKIGNGVDVWGALTYGEAATFQEVLDLITDLQTKSFWKPNAVASATGNIVPLLGVFPLDGFSCQRGDWVFLPAQSNPVENGPWTMQSGTWTRPPWFLNDTKNIVMARIRITNGDTLKGREFQLFNPLPVVIGTDALNFQDVTPNSSSECTIDITGATNIDMTGNEHCGIVNLTSSNANETIDNILNSKVPEIEFRPTPISSFTVTFRDYSVASPGNMRLGAVSRIINANKQGFLRLKSRNSMYYETQSMLSYY